MRFKNFEERIFGRNKRKDTQKGFTAPPCPSLHWNTAPTASWGSPVLKRKLLIRVCAKITSDFGGSAAGPDARRKGGSVSPRDTRPTEPRSRWPGAAPPLRAGGLGRAGCVAPRSQTARVCSLVAPCQPAQSPPAKSELIFAQTLSQASLWQSLRRPTDNESTEMQPGRPAFQRQAGARRRLWQAGVRGPEGFAPRCRLNGFKPTALACPGRRSRDRSGGAVSTQARGSSQGGRAHGARRERRRPAATGNRCPRQSRHRT